MMGQASTPKELQQKDRQQKELPHTKTGGNEKKAPQALSELLKSSGLWRASSIDASAAGASNIQPNGQTYCSTGFTVLDQQLPGAGWPASGVTELLHRQYGIGEFRLLAPALATLSHQQNRWLHIVSPPYIPYPPALAQAGVNLKRIIVSRPRAIKDYLWVLEKSLASGSCSMVIAWPQKISDKQLRRLQVASKAGGAWSLLFRHEKHAANASPAELRIRLLPAEQQRENSAVSLEILKRRGRWKSECFTVNFPDQLQRHTPDYSEMQVRNPVYIQPSTGAELVPPRPAAPSTASSTTSSTTSPTTRSTQTHHTAPDKQRYP